jgi:hypothetical protein
MFVLSLLVVLAATPLRLAEAADDLACSLSELARGDGIEANDGGVGDHSGATIKAEATNAAVAIAIEDLWTGDPGLAMLPLWRILVDLAELLKPRAASLPRRLAILQCFLC